MHTHLFICTHAAYMCLCWYVFLIHLHLLILKLMRMYVPKTHTYAHIYILIHTYTHKSVYIAPKKLRQPGEAHIQSMTHRHTDTQTQTQTQTQTDTGTDRQTQILRQKHVCCSSPKKPLQLGDAHAQHVSIRDLGIQVTIRCYGVRRSHVLRYRKQRGMLNARPNPSVTIERM